MSCGAQGRLSVFELVGELLDATTTTIATNDSTTDRAIHSASPRTDRAERNVSLGYISIADKASRSL